MITKEEIQEKVRSDPRWAARAIVVLYDRQTADEQNVSATIEHNTIGFNGVDAEILSSFARQVLAGRTLSQKQLAIAYKKLPKYWRQLLEAAKAKGS